MIVIDRRHDLDPFPTIGTDRFGIGFQLLDHQPVEHRRIGQIAVMLGLEQIAQDTPACLLVGLDADELDAPIPGFSSAGFETDWCGRPELNRHGLTPNGFSYPLRLSPPDPARRSRRRGLGSGLSLHPGPAALGAARLVSTPSRFRAWLGIAISQVSPNLGSSASSVSRRALKFGLSPLRLPISPRPHRG